MSERADAVVIGAGVIGSSVALELARGGRKVIVVDKGPSAGAGSTSSSSAIIRFCYSTPDAVLTAWESAAAWADFAGYLGHTDPDGMGHFVRTGHLIFRIPGANTQRFESVWNEVGIVYEDLDTQEIARRWPGFDVGAYFPPKRIDDPAFGDDATSTLTAIFESQSGVMDDPMLCAQNFAYAAKQHGAEYRFHQEVVSIDREGGHVSGVSLAGGERIVAPVVVNVGGPHASVLNRMADVVSGMRISHRPLRSEVFTVEAPKGMTLEDGFPTLADLDVGQYIKPHFGGTWDVGCTEPDCDELHWIDDPEQYDPYPTVEQFEVSTMRVARRVPEFGIPHRPTGLAALYDVTTDWVPLYDKSDLPGFFMACGTSGNQFKNAPLAGQFLKLIIDAEAAGIDHDEQPVQYVGPRTGRSINIGSFSRRRDPWATSNGVMG